MSADSQSAVSVVVATKDRGDKIRVTVASILQSDASQFEIIVVDQSEDDQTERALQSFFDNPRLRYMRSSTQGVSVGRNIGIRMAESDLIFITDDDCEVPPECLQPSRRCFCVG